MAVGGVGGRDSWRTGSGAQRFSGAAFLAVRLREAAPVTFCLLEGPAFVPGCARFAGDVLGGGPACALGCGEALLFGCGFARCVLGAALLVCALDDVAAFLFGGGFATAAVAGDLSLACALSDDVVAFVFGGGFAGATMLAGDASACEKDGSAALLLDCGFSCDALVGFLACALDGAAAFLLACELVGVGADLAGASLA